jgi:hypothetical protein
VCARSDELDSSSSTDMGRFDICKHSNERISTPNSDMPTVLFIVYGEFENLVTQDPWILRF